MSTPPASAPDPWAFLKHHLRDTRPPWADVAGIKLARPLVFLVCVINAARRNDTGAVVNYGKIKVQGPAPADTATQKQKILGLHPSIKEALAPLLDDAKHEVIVIFEIHFSGERLMYSLAFGIPYSIPAAPTRAL